MKNAARILGGISALSFVLGLASIIIWLKHFQLESTGWDVFFWAAYVAAIVWLASGCLAIALLLASWVSRRFQHP